MTHFSADAEIDRIGLGLLDRSLPTRKRIAGCQ
jgi:hypothetical protein